ncbi:MAG: tRNA 2-thiouridine(34) synthase MnmA [Planctomycetota bacterium]
MPLAKPGNGKKVVLAMSGGVDSSAAAALLKEDGYEVVGCFMRLGSDDPDEIADGYDNLHRSHKGKDCALPILNAPHADAEEHRDEASGTPKKNKQGCCSVNDAADGRLVAAILGIPFYVVNFRKDFGRIMDYFVDEYNAGRTPNPCVRCNDWLKFGKLHDYAKSIDADYVASGHYAQIIRRTLKHGGGYPRASLARGVDRKKDQSYVLFGTPREQLDHTLLPIGHLQKSETRQIAEAHNLPVFNKPDSMEICFVPDNDYARLVERRTPGGFTRGNIIDTDGNVLGEHAGHQHFTLGQRRGLGIAAAAPLYVIDKDPATNTVTVGGKHDLQSTGCSAREVNWLAPPHAGWQACLAKARYNSEPVPAQCRLGVDERGQDTLEVRFDQPLQAVTPGQAVVCYEETPDGQEQIVLGGGWIDKAVSVQAGA